MARGGAREGSHAEARKAFAAGKVSPVVLLAGPETLYAEELSAALLAVLVTPDLQPFNFNRFRAGQDPTDLIFGTAGTLPMFAERRLVIVQDASEFDRKGMDELTRYLSSPSPSTVLLLIAEETGEKLPAALKKVSERYTLWRPFPSEAVAWAVERARGLGKTLTEEIAQELFGLCSGDSGDGRAALSDLAIEIEKLCLSVGERKTINMDDLRVVGRHAEARVLYQVEAAVAARHLGLALKALEAALLFPKENAHIRIVTMLGERFRKMLVARDRQEAGLSRAEVLAGMWFPGRDGGAEFMTGVARFRRAELAQALIELARLDRALKTGQAEPPDLHLELALRRICGVAPAAGTSAPRPPAAVSNRGGAE